MKEVLMKTTRSHKNIFVNLTTAAAVATVTALSTAGPLAHAEDNTVTAKEMKQPGLPDRYTTASTELFNVSVADFASMEVITREGEPAGKVQKVVSDTRENRGEAIIALQDGGKITVPLRQLRVKNDKIALPLRMNDQSEIQAAQEEYKKESVNDQYQEVAAQDAPIGKYVYPSSGDHIEAGLEGS
jgi:sporulation protein YlmC with PRC-barrel domain